MDAVSDRSADGPGRPVRVVILGADNASGGVAGYINAIATTSASARSSSVHHAAALTDGHIVDSQC